MEDAKVPELRFRKEDGTEFPAWGGATFDNLLLPYKNNTFSRDKLTYENGVVKDIHYGDILVKFDSILDGTSTGIPYIEGMDDFEDTDHIYHVANGDIVIADTAEDYMVGKAVEVQNVQTPILAGLHTIPCHPKQKFARGYLGQYLNAPAYHSSLRRIVQGIKVLSLNKSSLAQTKIRYPSIPEQRKIALLFATIDERIALADKKITILHTIKKGMLQKIFSQELRFKDDDGNEFPAWKQMAVSDFIKFVGGATPSKDNPEYWNGDIIWLSSKEINQGGKVSSGTYTITKKAVNETGTKIVPAGTPLIITRSGILANRFPVSVSSCEVAINQDIKALIFDKMAYSIQFVVSLFEFNEDRILRNVVKPGTTVQSVNMPDLLKMKVDIPSLSEQQKIAAYFTTIDRSISAAQKKAESLRTIKKGLLQKMFV